ncbi:MAG: hypothetical protein DRP01_01200 [Archaeoglobales archaeon]|nr:MAG: hypothetical protein DRP01_01200 [Archaeoglobales archaeon]
MLWEELSSKYNTAFSKAEALRKEIATLKARQILASPEERKEIRNELMAKQKELRNAISQLYNVRKAFNEMFKTEIAELL